MYSKLSIGTANFGLNYGINNIQPPCNNEIKKILNYSSKIGIINIDTGTTKCIIVKYFVSRSYWAIEAWCFRTKKRNSRKVNNMGYV